MFFNSVDKTTLPKSEYGMAIERLKLIFSIKNAEQHDDKLKKFDQTYLVNDKISRYIALDGLWKLGLDAQDHNYGRLSYDNGTNTYKTAEPGYIDAMETALAYLFRTAEEELSPLFIKRLHFISCCDVRNVESYSTSAHASADDVGSRFALFGRCPLVTDCVTKEGLLEMAKCCFVKAYCYSQGETITLTPDTVEECWEAMQKAQGRNGEVGIPFGLDYQREVIFALIDEYEQNIAKAVTDDERILTIAKFAQQLEWAHFFPDGNLRTIRLLMLKLLIQNNLPLTCIRDPNIIDGHSAQQIADAIKQGMEVYKKIMPQVDIRQHCAM